MLLVHRDIRARGYLDRDRGVARFLCPLPVVSDALCSLQSVEVYLLSMREECRGSRSSALLGVKTQCADGGFLTRKCANDVRGEVGKKWEGVVVDGSRMYGNCAFWYRGNRKWNFGRRIVIVNSSC